MFRQRAFSAAPLRYAVTRALGKSSDVRRLSDDERVLAEPVTSYAPPALFDPADLERVRGVQTHTSLGLEMRRIFGGPVVHAATRVRRLRNVFLHGSHLYVGGSRVQVALQAGSEFRPWRSLEAAPEGLFVSSLFASQFFGHWLTDQITAELLAAERGLPAYAAQPQRAYAHEGAIREALDLRVRRDADLFFETLWLPEDYGQNALKRARYARLRAALRRGARPRKVRGAFILRGRSGERRRLYNELSLAERLAREGFCVLDPARDSFETLRDGLHDAPVVVGVEGSALIHGVMMMPSDGCLLTLQPPHRFNNVHKDYTDCIGQRYAFTVGDPIDARGFALPVERLLAALDRVERAARADAS